MNEAPVSRVVRDARREIAPSRRDYDEPQLRVHIAEPKATIMLLPGRFRDAAYVQRHVEFVLSRSAEQGEQHVRRNLNALRRNLEDMGVDKIAIEAEVRRVEAAVRAEIWKQVLLPGGDE
jgi:hypothetical protein